MIASKNVRIKQIQRIQMRMDLKLELNAGMAMSQYLCCLMDPKLLIQCALFGVNISILSWMEQCRKHQRVVVCGYCRCIS